MSEIEEIKERITARGFAGYEEPLLCHIEKIESTIQVCKSKHKYLANSPEYSCPWCERETLLSSLEKEEQAHIMSVFDLNMKIAEIGIALEKSQEKVRELLTSFGSTLAFERIRELEIKLQKLVEAVKKHENETRAKFSTCVTEDDETLWKSLRK